MKKQTPKQTRKKTKKRVRNLYEYVDFIEWISLPKDCRSPTTQRELASKFGIGEDTLSDWKQRDDFWEEVEKKRKSWGKERTPNVLQGLYKKATKTGDPRAVRLWYEIVEGKRFNDKAPATSCTKCVTYTEIEQMSDEELWESIERKRKFFKKET